MPDGYTPDTRKRLTYETCCVQSTSERITALVQQERQISRRTFLRYVDRRFLWHVEQRFGYARDRRRGVTMASDWHVSYYRSLYDGRPCVFFRHSAIEYIFT